MEVKIGVQHAPRELVVETDASPEDIEAQLAEAVSASSLFVLHRHPRPPHRGPRRQDRVRRDRRRRRGSRRLPLTPPPGPGPSGVPRRAHHPSGGR